MPSTIQLWSLSTLSVMSGEKWARQPTTSASFNTWTVWTVFVGSLPVRFASAIPSGNAASRTAPQEALSAGELAQSLPRMISVR